MTFSYLSDGKCFFTCPRLEGELSFLVFESTNTHQSPRVTAPTVEHQCSEHRSSRRSCIADAAYRGRSGRAWAGPLRTGPFGMESRCIGTYDENAVGPYERPMKQTILFWCTAHRRSKS
jgi:hypothetical protein